MCWLWTMRTPALIFRTVPSKHWPTRLGVSCRRWVQHISRSPRATAGSDDLEVPADSRRWSLCVHYEAVFKVLYDNTNLIQLSPPT